MNEELIQIDITPFDASLFMKFQKHYAFIKLLESLDVFDVKTGSVTIHFNAKGQIGSIEVNKKYIYPQDSRESSI